MLKKATELTGQATAFPPRRGRLKVRLVLLLLAGLLASSAPVFAGGGANSLFWKIERDGQPAGFLLGTIHSEDPRVLDFSEEFIQQLTANDRFAMEMVPDLPTLQKLTEYMHYDDGSSLEDHVGSERYASIRSALSSYKVPPEWISKMKIWAVVMTLSMPAPKSGLFMDFSLSLRASGAGLKVVGLETLEEQLAFLEDMPEHMQLQLLDQALQDYDRVQEIHTGLVEDYLKDDLSALQASSDEQIAELEAEAAEYFMAEGVDARNLRMMNTLQPVMDLGTVFVAVGALHLPGETGLVSQLRDRGYTLTALPLPFHSVNASEQE